MHKEFADWFRVVSIEPSAETLKARWGGIEEFVKNAGPDDLIDAVRVFYDLRTKGEGFLDRFRNYFKSVDPAFPMSRNDAELRVLAGAALTAHFEYSDGRAEAAALLLKCGAFRDLRPTPIADIVRLAREWLSSQAAISRQASEQEQELPSAETLHQDFQAVISGVEKCLQAGGAPPTFAEPVSAALKSLSRAIEKVVGWANAEQQQLAFRREESDILWWLFGEHSRDLRLPFRQLKMPGACLVIAKELSDLTMTPPGPYSARAFLDKAIATVAPDSSASLITLAAAVASCPPEWRKIASACPDLDLIEDLYPTCFALRKAVEADGKKTWEQAFNTVTGIKAQVKIRALDLTEQAYDEWLSLRAIRSLRKAAQ